MLLQKSTFSTSSLALLPLLLLLLHSAGKINRNAIKLITSMCASKLTYAPIHTHTHPLWTSASIDDKCAIKQIIPSVATGSQLELQQDKRTKQSPFAGMHDRHDRQQCAP